MRVALLTFISALFAACLIAPAQAQNTLTQQNDINALNYALALENLEATYYSCYLYPLNTTNSDCVGRGYNGFSQADFLAAGYNASVYAAVVAIGQQELSHRTYLSSVVTALGGSPVGRCIYNFNAIQPVTSVATFLTLSMILENTGVSAYAGAVNALTDPTLAQAAVTIASVEARHAAWLNQLLGNQPFPAAFDTYRTPNEIAATISGALSSGSCVSTLPTTRPYGVAGVANQAGVTNFTGPYAAYAGANSGISYNALERANDLKTLNYALTLEQLEAAFYYQASLIFTQASFTAAGYNSSVYNNFVLIGLHEYTHVAVLRATISAYGGSPVANCTYNFTGALSSFANYINTAQVLENTGVSAYDGAANTLTDTNLQRIAATIDMVEARHAAYINVLNTNPTNNTNAFPAAYDTAVGPAAIVAAVLNTGLITSCPYPLDATTLPNVLPINYGVPNGTLNYSSSSSGSSSRSSSSSTGFNGASSSSAFSLVMIVVAIIASLALVL